MPLAGRGLLSRRRRAPGAVAPVVVLSEELWRGLFEADQNVIRTSIGLDKKSFSIVGVMPTTFRFPALTANQQVWIPLVQDPLFSQFMNNRGRHFLGVIARLKPSGISGAGSSGKSGRHQRKPRKRISRAKMSDGKVISRRCRQTIVGSSRSALLVLLGAVGLVSLLIACGEHC